MFRIELLAAVLERREVVLNFLFIESNPTSEHPPANPHSLSFGGKW